MSSKNLKRKSKRTAGTQAASDIYLPWTANTTINHNSIFPFGDDAFITARNQGRAASNLVISNWCNYCIRTAGKYFDIHYRPFHGAAFTVSTSGSVGFREFIP